MSIRAFAVSWSALLLLFPWSARAQSADVDEFDLGDEWVAADNEGGWFAPWTPILAPDSGGFRLDLSGGIGFDAHRQADQQVVDPAPTRLGSQKEYYALATLEVPLDRIFAGRGAHGSSGSFLQDDRLLLAQYGDAGSEKADSNRRTHRTDVDASGTKPSEPRSTSDDPAAHLQGEPEEEKDSAPHGPPSEKEPPNAQTDDLEQHVTPEETVQVAREIADRVASALDGADGRIRSLVRRSRWSGLSPELRLRGVLGFDRATSTEEPVGIYAGDTTVRGGRDSLAEVRLTFRLDRLVLGDGESSLERQRIDLLEDRRKLIKEALSVFSDWRLSQARAEDISLPPDDRLKATIDAESALAELHLLTDGWFQGTTTLKQLSRQNPTSGPTRAQTAPVR